MGRWVALGWVCVMGLVAGCSPADKAQIHEGVQGIREEARSAATEAQRAAANTQLGVQVKNVLSNYKGLDAHRIDVKAKDGVVTLQGNVTSRDQADLAEKVAGQVKGVNSVQDQLTIPVPAKSMPPGTTGGTGTGSAGEGR